MSTRESRQSLYNELLAMQHDVGRQLRKYVGGMWSLHHDKEWWTDHADQQEASDKLHGLAQLLGWDALKLIKMYDGYADSEHWDTGNLQQIWLDVCNDDKRAELARKAKTASNQRHHNALSASGSASLPVTTTGLRSAAAESSAVIERAAAGTAFDLKPNGKPAAVGSNGHHKPSVAAPVPPPPAITTITPKACTVCGNRLTKDECQNCRRVWSWLCGWGIKLGVSSGKDITARLDHLIALGLKQEKASKKRKRQLQRT